MAPRAIPESTDPMPGVGAAGPLPNSPYRSSRNPQVDTTILVRRGEGDGQAGGSAVEYTGDINTTLVPPSADRVWLPLRQWSDGIATSKSPGR